MFLDDNPPTFAVTPEEAERLLQDFIRKVSEKSWEAYETSKRLHNRAFNKEGQVQSEDALGGLP